MKVGTPFSPWRYDAAACRPHQSARAPTACDFTLRLVGRPSSDTLVATVKFLRPRIGATVPSFSPSGDVSWRVASRTRQIRNCAPVARSRCVLASDQPSRMLGFMLIRGHLAQCRDQGGNNVQRAMLAQWRKPHGVWGSDIPCVRRRVLFSGLREEWLRNRCRDVERRYAAATRWA